MDDDLRSLERAWEQTPHDLAACDAYARAARRAGRPVPLAVLEARRHPPRRLDIDAPVDVSAELDDGWQVSLGVPSRRPPVGLDVPSCREWWIQPQGVPFGRLVQLTRDLGAPHLEVLNWGKRDRLDAPDLRSVHVEGALPLRGWERLAELPALERLAAGRLTIPPDGRCPQGLLSLGAPRLSEPDLEAMRGWPPLTALDAMAARAPLAALVNEPALRLLEMLAYSGDPGANLGLLSRWPNLRRLRLRGMAGGGDVARAASQLARLEALRVDWCGDLSDADLRTLTCGGGGGGLHRLRLANAQRLTDLSCLSRVSGLRQVVLSARRQAVWEPEPADDQLADGGIAELAGPRLEELALVGFARVTGASLQPSAFPALRRLFLPVGSLEAARRVAELPCLELLDTRMYPMTPDMLEALGRCRTMRAMRLFLPAGSAGLASFLEAVPLEELTLVVEVLTKDVVDALGRSRSLRRLELSSRSTERIEQVALDGLGELPAVEDLTLHAHASLGSWQALARAPRLRAIRWSSARRDHPLVQGRSDPEQVHIIGGRGAWRKRAEWFA